MQHSSACSCSRRTFLRGSGLTLAGFGLTSLFPVPLIRQAMAGTANDRRLLFIFLRGGNDAVNAVIPYGDSDYNLTNRPTLFIPQASSIDLNGFAALHPALGDLMEPFNAGDLAIIHRAGYQNNSRSHFDGQRIWENGDPTQPQLFEGWLYRYIVENAAAAGADLPALTIQPTAPVILNGDEKFVNIANPDNFDYNVGPPLSTKFGAAWRGVYNDLVGLEPYRPVLSQTGVKLVDTIDEYASWDQQNWNPTDPVSGWHLFPVSFDTNPEDPMNPGQRLFSAASYDFFRSLKVAVLSLLESEGTTNGTRIAGTQLTGWDTHNGQGQLNGQSATLLSWLGYGLRSIRVALSGAATNEPRAYPNIWNKTLAMTMSEFGRTTLENGSGGTDHAAAGCLFVEGGSVNGGVYNCDPGTWPPGVLFGVNERYLLERTDYRAVFWEILRDHMGATSTPDAVFPDYTSLGLASQELGVIATGP